jgi:cell wall-associated NlpC family hydrolase
LLHARAMALIKLSLVTAALAVGLVACSSAAPDANGNVGGDVPAENTLGAQLPPDESGGDVGDDGASDGDMALVPADETAPAQTQTVAAAQTLETTADLNLRSAPSTSASVLAVIPVGSLVTVLDPTPQNGFYNVKFNGTAGWSYATYLTTPSTGGGTTSGGSTGGVDPDGSPSPDNAVARAALSVGFSYYWGGGAWQETGATSSNKGSCSGSCPSCSHSGKYGADCSGMVAKAWQYGTKALDVNSHPYSTSSFVVDQSGKWSTVSRGSLKKGDALVYNTGSAGHIVLWEKGDGWGSSTVYECKGCSYGCVHDTRTFSSSYHGIRRAGF